MSRCRLDYGEGVQAEGAAVAQRLTPAKNQIGRRAGERQHQEDQGDPARALLDRLIGVDSQFAGEPEGRDPEGREYPGDVDGPARPVEGGQARRLRFRHGDHLR